jgi:ATP-dependent Clp protease ATP-binding subunit ClpC
MATRMCEVCGVRPATVAIRRITPGEPPRIEHLCEVHAAEARGGRSRLGGSPLGGGSLFDDFFDRFFEEGAPGGARRSGAERGVVPERRAEQVDITQLFSDSTDELLQRAARRAAQWGSADLNTEHLLHAALEDGVVRRVLEGADAAPDQIRAQLEEQTEKESWQGCISLAGPGRQTGASGCL